MNFAHPQRLHLAKASKALAAGRRDEALVHAWNALRSGGYDKHELAAVDRLATELDDAALAAAVAVRRLRRRPPRLSDSFWSRVRKNAVAMTVGFAWWLGWSGLVAFALIENRVLAVVAAIVAAPLLMVGVAKGWVHD